MTRPLITSGALNLLGEIQPQPSWNPQSDGGGIGLIHSLMGEIVHILGELLV